MQYEVKSIIDHRNISKGETMMNLRRVKCSFFMLVMVLAALLVLAGCGSPAPAPAPEPETPQEAEAPAEEPAEDEPAEELAVFTLDELAEYDGQDGRPAYVAVDGVVYDFTELPRWRGGVHNGFEAGKDLTDALNTVSPHGDRVLSRAPVVGELAE